MDGGNKKKLGNKVNMMIEKILLRWKNKNKVSYVSNNIIS